MNNLKEGYNVIRPKAKHTSLCFAPSVNMLFATDGTVKACCHNHENSLGRYPQQNIKQIWQSREAVAFRQNMADYNFLSGCAHCATDYQAGRFAQMPSLHFDTLETKQQYPAMMEFLLENTCNLECVMCSGELSSAIRANRDKLPPVKSPYDDAFISQLNEFIPHLKETRFSGAGEAFSVSINYKIWDKLIDGNPNCLIVVQTNGTVLNARVKDYLQRGNFIIGVSVDSLVKETYEAIRINALYERVMENVRFFADYSKTNNRLFVISTCVMRNNWHELPRFVEYCNSLHAHATFHKVWSPLEYALHNLSAAELATIHTTLKAYVPVSNSVIEQHNKAQYEYFTAVIAQWAAEAAKRETALTDLSQLSDEVLLHTIKQRISNYIAEQIMLEEDKSTLLKNCIWKIDTVLTLWEGTPMKRKILIKLSSVPVAEILPTLKTQPVEKLFKLSGTNT